MSEKRYLIATVKSWNIEKARELNEKMVSVFEIITDSQNLTYEQINQINPRYIFFPHWSWKIPKEIYENWECVVFHMTDLPFGRGGSPLQNLIERGIKQTRISAIKVTSKIDAGPVYFKSGLIDLDGSAEEIFRKASLVIFNEMIPYIIKNEPTPQSQIGEPVIFKRRTPEQSNISKLEGLEKIYNFIRMLDAEDYPKAYLEAGKIRVEFSEAKKKTDYVQATAKIFLKEKICNE